MSGINGDKARFHVRRKKKIHRRERTREMLKTLAKTGETVAATAPKSKAGSH